MRLRTPKQMENSQCKATSNCNPNNASDSCQANVTTGKPHNRTYVFPAYRRIYADIANQKKQKMASELQNLTKKVNNYQSTVDIKKTHRYLLRNLIASYRRYPNNEFVELQDELNGHCEAKEFVELPNTNANKLQQFSSLNEYLDHSEESQNNYENSLKFRKKVLQREMNSETVEDIDDKQKQNNQEKDEQLFRELFKSNQNCVNGSVRTNKLKLNQCYKKYVLDLSETNVVKWRILNDRI